jgi:hypothetical protein
VKIEDIFQAEMALMLAAIEYTKEKTGANRKALRVAAVVFGSLVVDADEHLSKVEAKP